MLIIKNALSNIWCNKGRNILIGIIVLVIAVSSCIALSVKRSAKTAEEEGLKNLSISANISFDREKLMQNAQKNNSNGGNIDFREQMRNIKELTLDEMQTYAKSSHVSEFRYTLSTSINGNDSLEAVTEDTSSSSNTNSNDNQGGPNGIGDHPGGGGFNFSQGDFSLIGYSTYSAMTDFVSGSSKVTSGEIFNIDSDSNECVISTELATFNNLKVGDKITLANPNNETQTFTFTIKGLYSYTSSYGETSFGRRFSTAMDPANQIYTSYKALNKVVSSTNDNATKSTDTNGREITTALRAQTSGNYTFKSIENYNAFVKDVKTMGLRDDYVVNSADLTNYENSLLPIKNTAKFADMMLFIILGVGGIILIVLNIFNIRERKYEVGVLTAIGMKKGKVAIQFITELLIVTFIAIIIGTASGAVASVPVSNTLLQSQVSAQQTKDSAQSTNFGRPGQQFPGIGGGQMFRPGQQAQKVDYVSTLNASTNLLVVIQLMGIGILLTIIASLSAVVFVMRYEPLKILSERT
jgi:putative ABC transport system permease protein